MPFNQKQKKEILQKIIKKSNQHYSAAVQQEEAENAEKTLALTLEENAWIPKPSAGRY